MDLYQINNGHLTLVPRADVFQAGLKETADLESWIKDADRIFGRKRVLWISRQERTASDERADLIGIDGNELLVVELKRGTVSKEAISQALAYLTSKGKRNRQELLDLYVEHAAKTGKNALLATPLNKEDAETRFAQFEPKEGSVNESHRIILVGTDFLAETLQICGYLNEQLTGGILILECWQMKIFHNGTDYLCSFDKLMPSRDVEAEIETKREQIRANSYKRDTLRKEFMQTVKWVIDAVGLSRNSRRGESYGCRVPINGTEHSIGVYLLQEGPDIWVPKDVAGFDYSQLTGLTTRDDTDEGVDYTVARIEGVNWVSDRSRVARDIGRLILRILGRDAAVIDTLE
jgi:hypothetical protein